jgi:hypothetical protein
VGLRPCELASNPRARQLWKFVPHHVENDGDQTTDGFMIESYVPSLVLFKENNLRSGPLTVVNPAGYLNDNRTLFGGAAIAGAIPTWSELHVNPTPSYALAAGDLDRVVGADGQYHDEAVVAYADPDRRLQVRVIDYNANPSHLLVSAPNVELPLVGAAQPRSLGNVDVAVGDFDGGPGNQIAVTWQDADTPPTHMIVAARRWSCSARGPSSAT